MSSLRSCNPISAGGTKDVRNVDKKTIMELRGRAQSLQCTVHIGKEGMTERVIEEIERQLKKNKIVKIKLLSSLEMDRRNAARMLAEETRSTLIEVRGFTVVLAAD